MQTAEGSACPGKGRPRAVGLATCGIEPRACSQRHEPLDHRAESPRLCERDGHPSRHMRTHDTRQPRQPHPLHFGTNEQIVPDVRSSDIEFQGQRQRQGHSLRGHKSVTASRSGDFERARTALPYLSRARFISRLGPMRGKPAQRGYAGSEEEEDKGPAGGRCARGEHGGGAQRASYRRSTSRRWVPYRGAVRTADRASRPAVECNKQSSPLGEDRTAAAAEAQDQPVGCRGCLGAPAAR